MTLVLLTLLFFSLEILLPFQIQPFFHGIPILCGLTVEGWVKYPLVFLLSFIQTFMFGDHGYSIPFDLMAVWLAEKVVKVRWIKSNLLLTLSSLLMALVVSHILQFSIFDNALVTSSLILWYSMSVAILFRRRSVVE